MKKWSLPLGKIFGIEIKIHFTFFLFFIFLTLSGIKDLGIKKGISSAFLILSVFICVLLHEISHSLVGIKYGGKVKNIILLPIGGIAQMEKIPTNPFSELKMAIAGPLTNFILAGILYLIFYPKVVFGKEDFVSQLTTVNVILGTFNLLPAFPMDGGRILRGLLGIKKGYYFATKIAIKVGKIFSIGLILFGLYFHLWLVFIGLFVFIGAISEENIFKAHFALFGLKASQIMVEDFKRIPPENSLLSLFNMSIKSSYEVFVIEKETIYGIIKKKDIPSFLDKFPLNSTVYEICNKNFIVVSPETEVDKFLSHILIGKISWVAVVENGYLKGVIYPESISDAITLIGIYKKRNFL